MHPDRWRIWIQAATAFAVGPWLVWTLELGVVASLLVLSITTAGAWWVSPLRAGDHTAHDEALARAGPRDVIVYWKPGCTYCTRLRRALGDRRSEVVWVNTNVDVAAARHVADLNDGNVLTPTVQTGGGRRLPPSAEAITRHLDDTRR